MVEKLLKTGDCAECRGCCEFFENELWEIPVIDDDLAHKLSGEYEFDFIGDNRVFKMSRGEKGLYICPALGENGCELGDEKPFDCKIWPFRVMKLGGFNVITVSPLCKKVSEKPLSELSEFAARELAEKIKTRFSKYPAPIKDYVYDYPILKVL